MRAAGAPAERLPPDAVLVFEALLTVGPSAVHHLADAAGLDLPRTDTAVEILTRSDLVRVTLSPIGDPIVELGSTAALRRLLTTRRLRVSPRAARLLEARMLLSRTLEHTGQPITGGLQRITDLADLRRQLADLQSSTRTEVVSLHAGRLPSGPELASHRSSDLELLGRGVDVKVVYPAEFARDADLVGYAVDLRRAGARVRFAGALPHRLVVADARRAVIPIDVADPSAGAFVVAEPTMVRSLRHLALSIFRRGEDLADPDTMHLRPPTPLERRVLILMSSGITDQSAARQLSVTDRTFRRYVADILRHLGASSRFQAGVKAVERGWL